MKSKINAAGLLFAICMFYRLDLTEAEETVEHIEKALSIDSSFVVAGRTFKVYTLSEIEEWSEDERANAFYITEIEGVTYFLYQIN